MKSFIVVMPMHGAGRQEIEIVLQSFACFYFSVTKRHQSRLKLVIIEDGTWLGEIMQSLQTFKISGVAQIVFQEEATLPEMVKVQSAVMFLPSVSVNPEWLDAALANGVPVMGFEDLTSVDYLDNSCGMMINHRSKEMNISAFSKWLRMLYFDPGAQEMLRKGALRKYRNRLTIVKEQYLTKVA